jgi:aspartate-semialdehyde dehydrogenase
MDANLRRGRSQPIQALGFADHPLPDRSSDRRFRVALLGATGAVGQRFVQLLSSHPWFEVTALVASDRSAGKPYGDEVRWMLPTPPPPNLSALMIQPPSPDGLEADMVFSALDPAAALDLESSFREAGFLVVTNASSHRRDPEVPLVVPEINGSHLEMVSLQRARYGGAIVANPNCSTIGLCLALEPLRMAFGVKRVLATTLQALSGAGHPGISSLDALDNVLPQIPGEEEKLRCEPAKIFGEWRADQIIPWPGVVSAQCNRVAVRNGHLLSLSVELERTAEVEAVREAVASYRSPLSGLNLPSSPDRPVLLREEPGRPQPLLDRGASGGMAVTVGRLQECGVLDVRMVALVHNTIRGAAGGTILIAELLAARGLIGSQFRKR